MALTGGFAFLLEWSAVAPAAAAVTLPALISDHMVLQRSGRTSLWGTAKPGERVSATLSDARGEATTGADGRWRLDLNLSRTGEGPFPLTVEGTNRIVVSDVLVGEVWLAAGQSNMAFRMAWESHLAEEKARMPLSRLREFHVAFAASPVPRDDCGGKWVAADAGTLEGFSAVGYYFARNLQEALGAPVGWINSSAGGTVAESWTSLDALDANPELAPGAAQRLQKGADADRAQAAYLKKFAAWRSRYVRDDKAPPDSGAFPTDTVPSNGTPVALPGRLATAGLPDAGAVWLWKRITLPAGTLGREVAISPGDPDGFTTVYWNGRKLGGTSPDRDAARGPARACYATADRIDNVLAIRLYSPAGDAGVPGKAGAFSAGPISLKGDWVAKAEYALPPLDEDATAECPPPPAVDDPRNRPAHLYNGMIRPLVSVTLKGVAWYQGENNTDRGYQYRITLATLIRDWRKQWCETLPFCFCQLPSYGARKPEPSESDWADLRESQTKALEEPATGEAVLIDLGETSEIHYPDKREAGRRLASVALAQAYGKGLSSSGPVLQSFRIEGDEIRISFAPTEGGLVAGPLPETYRLSSTKPDVLPLVRNSPEGNLEGFAVCGEDRRWRWASATIDGNSVVVRSPEVPYPIAARYAWADTPTCNLRNGAGLPAGPFRTDDFPLPTQANRF